MMASLPAAVRHTKGAFVAALDEDAFRLRGVGTKLGTRPQLWLITTKMADIRKRLGSRATANRGAGSTRPKRHMSAAARKRIAAAQKKRWAAYHAKQNAR